jgi:predicted benzoate:H+ symporter BenE
MRADVLQAIAAVAIARKFSVGETVSAGFTTSGVVFIFSVTGLLKWSTRAIPTPVVKGIQAGAGLSLVISAGTSLLQPLGWTTPHAVDNLVWGILAFLALLLTQRFPRVPYALLIFTLGLILSCFIAGRGKLPSFRIWHPHTILPSWAEFRTGALDAGLGQIPLTTLNSVIAVSYLSADLFPHLPTAGVTSIGISVAVMNLIGGWFGAMPVCHGSGGLAAQYRFGARSGASIIILGSLKIILGLLFGETLVGLLRAYPKSLLGVMVLAAGLELAKVGESLNHGARDLWEAAESETNSRGVLGIRRGQRELSDEERVQRWTVMFVTVGGLLAFKNDGVGFIAGMVSHWVYQPPNIKSVLRGWTRRGRWGATVGEEERLLPET